MVVLAAADIQLVPNGTLLVHIVMILVMIWILNRTFFRPINQIIESRLKHKGGHSTEAEKILADVEAKNVLYEKKMLDARSKGYEMIEKERAKAVGAKTEKIAVAKQEIAGMIANEGGEIAKQTDAARKTIATDAQKMAEKIAKGILK